MLPAVLEEEIMKRELIREIEIKYGVRIVQWHFKTCAFSLGRLILLSKIDFKILSCDALRFTLLHEVGHINQPIFWTRVPAERHAEAFAFVVMQQEGYNFNE